MKKDGSHITVKLKVVMMGVILFVIAVISFIFLFGSRISDYSAKLDTLTVDVNVFNEFVVSGRTDGPIDEFSAYFDGNKYLMTNYDKDSGLFLVETSADEDQPKTTEFELRHGDAVVLKETVKLRYPRAEGSVENKEKEDPEVLREQFLADKEKERRDRFGEEKRDVRIKKDDDASKDLGFITESLSDEDVSNPVERPDSFVAKPGEHDEVIKAINDEMNEYFNEHINGELHDRYYNPFEVVKEFKYEGNRRVKLVLEDAYDLFYPQQKDLIINRLGLYARSAIRRAEFWTLEDDENSLVFDLVKRNGEKVESFTLNEYQFKGAPIEGDGFPLLTRDEVRQGRRNDE